jgi:uncharacterized protein (UPF0332 family)/predicted nucleotidyltransferase
MATLATPSLDAREQDALDTLVEDLERLLGDELHAVWLFGSRARGEEPHEDSDVDLLVVTEAERGDPRLQDARRDWPVPFRSDLPRLSMIVVSPEWVAENRAIEDFFLREVERDRVVLAGGEVEDPAGFEERAPKPIAGDGLMTRTHDFLERAETKLRVARAALGVQASESTISSSYYAAFNAARAALSEQNLYARTHGGTWHLVQEHLVAPGHIPAELAAAVAALEELRVDADYNALFFSDHQGREALDAAERFVAAVRELLGA